MTTRIFIPDGGHFSNGVFCPPCAMQSPQATTTFSSAIHYLLLIVLTGIILYFGKGVFIPMFYGLLIAIVMYPASKWLEQKLHSRSLAITLALSFVAILFLALVAMLIGQVAIFRKDIPGILLKLQPLLVNLQAWLTERFSITIGMQNEWLHNAAINSSSSFQNIVFSTLSGATTALFDIFITVIYAALFLYNRGTFVTFLRMVVNEKIKPQLDAILKDTIHTYYNYIKGMVLVYIIVGVLNSIGLYLLGIEYAILFGMMTAIMTIIPYVGIIISALLPISVAFLTKDSLFYPLAVIGVFSFVQYLEANVIFPNVVGRQLKVSTWATLVAILTGGVLWGVSGMILFIPFVGILKIITGHIPEWKPLNLLLGRDED
jgi:predicted PurR-regulated permease PerM